jgi:hypothetical protein
MATSVPLPGYLLINLASCDSAVGGGARWIE